MTENHIFGRRMPVKIKEIQRTLEKSKKETSGKVFQNNKKLDKFFLMDLFTPMGLQKKVLLSNQCAEII